MTTITTAFCWISCLSLIHIYIIIGLGNYGHVLAEELSALGHEVIGADVSVGRVDSLKEKIATAFVIDATDEQALSVLPLNSVDAVSYTHLDVYKRQRRERGHCTKIEARGI